MRDNDTFQGAYKTQRGRYKDFNGLRALWFSDGFKNSYIIIKQKIGKKWYFVIQTENNKIIKKILIGANK